MTPEFICILTGTRARDALQIVRDAGLDSDAIYTLFVTDINRKLLGIMDIRRLLFAEGDEPVETLMQPIRRACGSMPISRKPRGWCADTI